MIIHYNRRENTGDVLFFFHIHPADNRSHRGYPQVCQVELSYLEGNHHQRPIGNAAILSILLYDGLDGRRIKEISSEVFQDILERCEGMIR